VILLIGVCELLASASLFAQEKQVFKGQITQCTCGAVNDHATVPDKVGSTVRCAVPCPNLGDQYVLSDTRNKIVYSFDKQDFPRAFAARNVFVIGILDKTTGTIRVNNILPDPSPAIKRAKTASIVCDACPRSMAKVKAAAFEDLTGWNRFVLVPDPKKADLIFLFSANSYLGDYLTRDGPDTRPVHIEVVYMNVIDPRTGVSLWGDSQRVGSWFVRGAAKDMLDELREFLEADESPAERKLFLTRHWIYKVATDTGK
jgi:hypothetical protein